MRRIVVGFLLAVLLAGIIGLAAVAGASGMPSATLPRPLRFSQPVLLGGVQAGRVEADGTLAGPVAVSGDDVVGAPGSVPGGSAVSICGAG